MNSVRHSNSEMTCGSACSTFYLRDATHHSTPDLCIHNSCERSTSRNTVNTERDFEASNFFGEPTFADATIRFSGHELKAHRIILCTRGQVLRACAQGGWIQGAQRVTKRLVQASADRRRRARRVCSSFTVMTRPRFTTCCGTFTLRATVLTIYPSCKPPATALHGRAILSLPSSRASTGPRA